MPLPEYVQAWLTEFDESSEPVDSSMISLILYTRLAERQTPADEVKSVFRVLAPLEFHIRPRGGSPWDTYFAPKHEGTNPAGRNSDYSDLADLDCASVDEWAALADRFTNPALKARFADAVWELAKRLAPARRDRYRFAVMAAESYLKAAQEGRYGSPVLQLEPMARAVSLALSINSEYLTRRSVEYSLDFVAAVDPSHLGLWMAPFDKLLSLGRLPRAYQERILTQFESRFEESVRRRDLHSSTMAGQALAQYHYVRQNYDRAKEVTRAYGELKLELTTTMTASIAVHHISDVLEDYRRQGLREDADRVRLLLEERGKGVAGEMKRVWIPIRIDSDNVERFTREVLDVDDPYVALFRVAYSTLPNVDRIRGQLAARAEGFLIRHLIPTSITGDNGLPVAVVNTYDDDQHDCLNEKGVREALEDKLWYFLKALYVDNRGLNLRNVMSHGIAEYEAFNKLNAALVVQSVVLLSIVRPSAVTLAKEETEQAGDEAPEGFASSDQESGKGVS